uniref:Uncharacterized protein n=1 Tax=Solanum lycopersicum TaxID=4081 RepID=A0A3Q7JC25_SOLLC
MFQVETRFISKLIIFIGVMFSEYINYGYSYESALPVDRLVVQLTDKAQVDIGTITLLHSD